MIGTYKKLNRDIGAKRMNYLEIADPRVLLVLIGN